MITYDSIAAMRLNRYIFDYNNQLNSINKQLKTGSSINKAADEPAKFNFTAKVKGYSELYGVANGNATSGISMIDTATDAISQMQNKLKDLEDILNDAKESGISPDERKSMQDQVNKLIKDIYDIKQNTGFNGLQIFELQKTNSTQTTQISDLTSNVVSGDISPYIRPVETKSDEYWENQGYVVVHSAQDIIDAFEEDSEAFIALGSDIDMSGINWTPLGDEDNPFEGILEGNGYKIKNLTIDSETSNNVGLFGYAEYVYFRNVAIENVNIKGKEYVGTFVGKAIGAEVVNSYVQGGSIEGNRLVGGLFGYIENSTIDASYTELERIESSTAAVGGLIGSSLKNEINQSYSNSNIVGHSSTGGFIGENVQTNIYNSYSKGTVVGESSAGGFVGRNASSSIVNSYSTTIVSGTNNPGAFIGQLFGNDSRNKVENSFFDIDVSGVTNPVGEYISSSASQIAGLQGLNTSQMQTPSTFIDAGWDTNIWILQEEKYPLLKNESSDPFPDKPDEPKYYGPLKAIKDDIRVQTGNDNSTSSYIMVNTALTFDDTFNFHVETKDFAIHSLENLKDVKNQLEQKKTNLTLSREQLKSEAISTLNKSKNGQDVVNALTGIDEDKLQAQKSKLISDIANAKSLRDTLLNLNAQTCQTLIMGAIYGNSSSSWMNNILNY